MLSRTLAARLWAALSQSNYIRMFQGSNSSIRWTGCVGDTLKHVMPIGPRVQAIEIGRINATVHHGDTLAPFPSRMQPILSGDGERSSTPVRQRCWLLRAFLAAEQVLPEPALRSVDGHFQVQAATVGSPRDFCPRRIGHSCTQSESMRTGLWENGTTPLVPHDVPHFWPRC